MVARSIVAVVIACSLTRPSAAICVSNAMGLSVLTANKTALGERGGVVVAQSRDGFQRGDGPTAWKFRDGTSQVTGSVVAIAPGLDVVVPKHHGPTMALVDSLGSVLVEVTNQRAAKALVAPAVTAVRIAIYQGRHHGASVVAILDGDPPVGAVAMVAYDKAGKRARSFGPVVANAKQILVYEASDCAPAADGTVATGADDDIRLAWLDSAGTLSAQTKPLHVQRE